MRAGIRGFAVVSLCVLGLPTRVTLQAQSAGASGTVELSTAIRTASLQVLPVALSRFALVSASGDTLPIATGRDGTATQAVPLGDYTVIALDSVEVEGSRYQWSLRVTVRRGQLTKVELTNLNAQVERLAEVPKPVSPNTEMELFRQQGGSVVRIEAGLGHGSGFIVDTLDGVILTNAHVVANAGQGDIAIILDSLTRAEAQLLARDNDADVAVLRVAPAFLEGRPRMRLAAPDVVLNPGDRLVALGYPLHQDLTMTTGVASGIRDGAIISDVNINPGNSGGPLLTLDGAVVAVNTFGDADTRGPGVSGSIPVVKAGPALLKAAGVRDSLGQPNDTLLPMMPKATMSTASLRAAAEAIDYKDYVRHSELKVHGRFNIRLVTPLSTFVELTHYEREVAKDRKKREAKAGVSSDQSYSEVQEYRDWSEYVGDFATPVVSLMVEPDVGETGGSLLGRALSAAVGVQSQAKLRFKGDVRGVRLLVGNTAAPVRPLSGGHGPVTVWEENRWVQLKDVADLGFYVYDPEAFRPSDDGTPPIVVIAVDDLKHPGRSACRILPKEEVARVWNDFEGYYRENRRDQVFTVANQKAKVDIRSVQQMLGATCEF